MTCPQLLAAPSPSTLPDAPSTSHEERRDGNVVRIPRIRRHHERHRDAGRELAHTPGALGIGALRDEDETRVARHLLFTGREGVPEVEAGAAGAGQEREQGEVLGSHDRNAHGTVVGRLTRDVRTLALRTGRHRTRPDRGGADAAGGTTGVARVEIDPEVVQ